MAFTLYNPACKCFLGLSFQVRTNSHRLDQPSYVKPAALVFDNRENARVFESKYVGYFNNSRLVTDVSNPLQGFQIVLTEKRPVQCDFEVYAMENFTNDTLVRYCATSYLDFLYVHSYREGTELTLNCMLLDPINRNVNDASGYAEMVVDYLENLL